MKLGCAAQVWLCMAESSCRPKLTHVLILQSAVAVGTQLNEFLAGCSAVDFLVPSLEGDFVYATSKEPRSGPRAPVTAHTAGFCYAQDP